MHQIRFPLGLRPRPCCRSLHRSSKPLTVFEGLLLSEGRVGEGREGKGRKGKRKLRRGGKNFGVARHLCQTLAGFQGPLRGGVAKEKGGERNGKGENGQEGGKGGGKLEQGRRLAKAGPGALELLQITIRRLHRLTHCQRSVDGRRIATRSNSKARRASVSSYSSTKAVHQRVTLPRNRNALFCAYRPRSLLIDLLGHNTDYTPGARGMS